MATGVVKGLQIAEGDVQVPRILHILNRTEGLVLESDSHFVGGAGIPLQLPSFVQNVYTRGYFDYCRSLVHKDSWYVLLQNREYVVAFSA